ncbi:DUF6861 domain-containing protein [Rugamonas sp. DEMB1]|uniref:DUF6861 domain-containing protein n=1 Tax=Rugamonas sp. DEMB1 TaxID=3039386 RepID=UPI002449BCEB|nr:deaminase domain-containing protein [Rugamonas sp. DEMB1]WGG52209.1 deaminase domain-containing protein [Rugamonas sp. DEMB1]
MSGNRFDRFEYYECLRQQDTLLDEAIARRRLADCPHGPFEHRLGLDGYLYIGARVRRVREAVAESQSFALRELQAKLGGIGLADVWPILREICHDVALYVGGGAIVGGAIGGGLGVFAFGAGALPGAAAGAALGTQAGNLLLGFFGLKSVVAFMLDSLPRATRAYRQGFFEAWGGMPDLGAYSLDAPHYGVDRLADSTYLAARAFARGHEILILALLAGVVAYLTRGKGQFSALLAEVRQSARLGPKMASWLEQNEGKLLNHPLLNERARGNGGGAIGSGPAPGAAAPGPRTGNQATAGTAPRDGAQAVGEAARKVLPGTNGIRTVENSLDRVNQLRQALDIGAKRNVAIAEYNINGEIGELVGISGNASRPGTVAIPETRRFETIATGNNTRVLDSEVKILEHLGSRLPPDATGTLHLFSELPLCVSCAGVVPQFQQAYPGIRVIVTHGPGR